MQESASNLGAFGFWIFLAVVVAGVMWAHMRKLQIRKELVQTMLEQGRPVDFESVDKLLDPWGFRNNRHGYGQRDPRSPYRTASFLFFAVGFATLFVALRQSPPVYLLALLAALPLWMAATVWLTCNREYASGTLATLKYSRDPREGWQQGGGWVFWFGYATVFVSVNRGDLNPYLMAMGILAIAAAFWIWYSGNRQYSEGKIPVHDPDPDDRAE